MTISTESGEDKVVSKERSQWSILKTFIPYMWPKGNWKIRARVVGALSLLLAGKMTEAYIPFIFKNVIDALSANGLLLLIPLKALILYSIARIFSQTSGELRDLCLVKVVQRTQRAISLKSFIHLHNLSMDFHLERQMGGLTRTIERGSYAIQTVINLIVFSIFPTILEFSFILGILIYKFNYIYALITTLALIAYATYTVILSNIRIKLISQMNQADSDAHSTAIDSMINFETVKYFTNESFEAKQFDRGLAKYETSAIKFQISSTTLFVGQSIIVAIALFFLMWNASKGVLDHKLTIGDFVLLNTFIIQLYIPLGSIGFFYRESKHGIVNIEQMYNLLDVESTIKDLPGSNKITVSEGTIEFKDVWFSYKPERPILKGISFKVMPGKSVAIVGPTGSGKSTISRLMFRFYDVQQGQIDVDSQDIKTVTQDSLRHSIGIVPQDTVLFNDTIGYNLAYGEPNATQAEIENAAHSARIDQLIQKLPEKYNTRVGERGLKLSGGEKQRVAIARTILKNPKILILDEATSALDTKTEKEILESLDVVSKSRTTLVIAHRLSTIVNCDEILVLKDGKIVERGSHQILLGLNGDYAEMWKKQN